MVKSEVAVARSRKRVTATLATACSDIHATATPFSFPPFFFYFSSHFIFSFHLILFLSFSITFLFAFHLILYPLAVASFGIKRAATKEVAVAPFSMDRYYYV